MRQSLGLTGKECLLRNRLWRCCEALGLLVFLLAATFPCISVTSRPVFAASHVAFLRGFSISPAQGPVGTAILVTGTSLSYADGTQINLGYTTDFSTCNVVSNSQAVGAVSNHSFSGWFRWPTSTGAGSFGVCIVVSGSRSFPVGNFTVLSASPPQVVVVPTIPSVNKQATVTGANFLPAGTSVSLTWQSVNGGPALALGTVTSDSTGSFTSTFTVPPRASTGSYTVTADAGSGQPPTLSAATTFHVNGITIVAVSTPTATASPTASPGVSPTVAVTPTLVASPVGSGLPRSANTGGGGPTTASKSALLLPIVLGGLLLIVVALIAGILLVRKQRALTAGAALGAGGSPWSAGESAAFSPAAVYSTGNVPLADNSVANHATMVYGSVSPHSGQAMGTIPFDPSLAEAMRRAQVSLFATPRPTVSEEVPT